MRDSTTARSKMQRLAPKSAAEAPVSPQGAGRFDAWLGENAALAALIVVSIGFMLRVRAAWGTFLNPDETLHFSLANQGSLISAYHASLTLAHPPLLILLLYFWRALGTSELVLRMPSIMAGSAFCWIFYKWLRDLMGSTVGLTGVVLMAFLPPIMAVTSEVRQYSLLLLFITCAAFLLERALVKESSEVMICAFVCLWLAMLSHYSALLFAAAFGIYSAWRLVRQKFPRRLTTAWIAGQLGAVALFVTLYRLQISRLRSSVLAVQAVTEWLRRSYFRPGQDNLLAFVLGRSFAVFQFIFGQLVVGDIAALFFIAGIVFLARGKQKPEPPLASVGEAAVFLVAPFAINCVLALSGKYPYGGTRHCVFLAIFAMTGISYVIAKMARWRPSIAVAVSVLIVAVCSAFGFHHQPYMTRADQSRAQMDRMIEFIQVAVPAADPVFVDYQANLMLSHYLCGQKPGVIGVSGYQKFQCAGHEIISAPPHMWMFTAETFPAYWDELIPYSGLVPGKTVWVVQAGWGASIAPDLQRVRDDLAPVKVQAFGRNISVVELRVKDQRSQ